MSEAYLVKREVRGKDSRTPYVFSFEFHHET